MHKPINEPLFRRSNTVDTSFSEVKLLKWTIEHREPILFGFFTLHFAKLRVLELYYNFVDKFCDVKKFEELEMSTDSLYLALAEEILYCCIQADKIAVREKMKKNDCREFF